MRLIELKTYDNAEGDSARVELRIGMTFHMLEIKKDAPLWRELTRVINALSPPKR